MLSLFPSGITAKNRDYALLVNNTVQFDESSEITHFSVITATD
jgi:hypothetical protein